MAASTTFIETFLLKKMRDLWGQILPLVRALVRDTADLVTIFCKFSYKPNKNNGFQRTIPSSNSDLYLERSEKYV
jgi:hypothetical protein